MIKVVATVERCPNGTYDVSFYDKRTKFSLRGNGVTAQEAIADFYRMNEVMKSHYAETGEEFPIVEYEFKYDVPSFLQGFAYAFTLAGLERITGVNQRQLSHYISGSKKPSEQTVRKIETHIHSFGKEISAVSFV